MSKGFFASLFDTSFSSLITTRVIKVIYVLTLVVIGLVALAFVLGAFARSAGAGVLTLFILAPLVSLVYIIYTRVFLELFIAIHRLVEYNGELVALTRQQMGLPPVAPAPAAATATPVAAPPTPGAAPPAHPAPPPATEPPTRSFAPPPPPPPPTPPAPSSGSTEATLPPRAPDEPGSETPPPAPEPEA